ncbi:MAG: hypothetical protein U0360_02030 [Dehalococcoidia bacterium]
MPERKRFLLRLDPSTYDALERWAGDELRSVNAQIEFALVGALRRAGRLPSRRPPPPPDEAADAGHAEAESTL